MPKVRRKTASKCAQLFFVSGTSRTSKICCQTKYKPIAVRATMRPTPHRQGDFRHARREVAKDALSIESQKRHKRCPTETLHRMAQPHPLAKSGVVRPSSTCGTIQSVYISKALGSACQSLLRMYKRDLYTEQVWLERGRQGCRTVDFLDSNVAQLDNA